MAVKKHFLLCMTSLHRPMEAMCQVHRFFAANRDNDVFDMSVVVRQVDERTFNTQIKADLQRYVDSGRLFLKLVNDKRHMPHVKIANMALDLAECVTLTKSEGKYNYYCKIDDDDFYHPDYVKTIYETTKKNDVIGCCVECSTCMQTTRMENEFVTSVPYKGVTCGGTMVFNNDVFKIFNEYAHNVGRAVDILKKYKMEHLFFKWMPYGIAEDRTLYDMMATLGQNGKLPFVKIKNKFLYSLYRIYPGFMAEER